MRPPSTDIAEYLESLSSPALVFGTDLFTTREPESPNQVVTIYDTPGEDPQAGFRYDKPNIQIRIRSDREDSQGAYAIAEQIKLALHGIGNLVIDVTRYVGIWAMGDIQSLGYDNSGNRIVYTINFRIHRTTN